MIWSASYDPGVASDLSVPTEPLPSLLLAAAAERTAIIFGPYRVSYGELRQQVDAVATALQRAGVGPGDRVLLLMPNMPPYVACYHGILKSGAAVVPVPVHASDTDIELLAADAQPTAAISIRMFYPVLTRVRSFAPLKVIVLAHIREYLKLFQTSLFPLLADRMASVAATPGSDPEVIWYQDVARAGGRPEPRGHDLAVLQYTSGTTGRPKGVMLTHRNLMANVHQVRAWLGTATSEAILAALPLSYLYAATGCMNLALLLRGTLVLLPTFDLDQVLEALKTHRPSIFPGNPSVYVRLAEHPGLKRLALSGLKTCISGGAPLPVEVKEAFERLTRSRLVEGYGLSECSPVTHVNPLQRHKTGTIGVPLPGTDARVVNRESRQPLPVGEVGELEVRGPQVMSGYWQRPELNARVLNDGWLRTGDLAAMDAEGYFQLVCRTQELIELGDGRVVYPRDIEEVLFEHPQVLDAAVVGLPRYGQDPLIHACVVPRRRESIQPGDVLAFCRTRLPAFKVPSQVAVRGSLPRNPEGKVLYRMLQTELSREADVMGGA